MLQRPIFCSVCISHHSLVQVHEEKLTKKEATAEKLVGAVVNAVANKTNKPKDDKEKVIKDILNKHKKALEKLS